MKGAGNGWRANVTTVGVKEHSMTNTTITTFGNRLDGSLHKIIFYQTWVRLRSAANSDIDIPMEFRMTLPYKKLES